MPYSVSPRRTLTMVGLKPNWNFSTRMPTRLAARKCPSSCTNTSTPRTNTKATIVVSVDKSGPSGIQFYRVGRLFGMLARPSIHCANLCKRAHFHNLVCVHRALNHEGDRGKRQSTFQESSHRDLVRRIQDNRQAGGQLEG